MVIRRSRPSTWIVAALLLAALGPARDASAQGGDCAALDPANYKSGCGSISVSSTTLQAGQKVIVNVSAGEGGVCGGGIKVSCSYARTDNVLVDGQPAAATSGVAPIYPTYYFGGQPQPAPASGAVVSISGGAHTIEFTISEAAPTDCVRVEGSSAPGPWIVLGAVTPWSSPVPVRIEAGGPIDVSLTPTTPEPDQVRPGQTMHYGLDVRLIAVADALTVEAPLPDGTTLVAGSVTGGGVVRRGAIRWSLADVDGAALAFAVEVQPTSALRGISAIVGRASARATFADASESDAVEVTTALVKPTTVRGVVRDVVLDFPNRTFVELGTPLAGAEVRLLAGDETVDSTLTDDRGAYEVEAPDPGTYTLEVRRFARRYGSDTNTLEPGAAEVAQERAVTIEADRTEPVELDVALPFSLVDHAQGLLFSLNNLSAALAGFVPVPARYDTAAIESALAAVLEARDEFPGVYTGSEPREGWNALIRMTAVLALFETRFGDNALLVEDFSKAVALGVTIEVIKKLGPAMLKRLEQQQGRLPDPTVMSRSIEAIKIGTLAYGVGVYLPKVLNEFDLTSAQKALIIEVVAKAVRFGFDRFAPGMSVQDAVFEVIFQSMRVAIFAFLTDHYMTETQPLLEQAAGLFATQTYADDTTATLQFLDRFDAKVGDRVKQLHGASTSALRKLSQYVRGIDGILFKVQGALGLSSLPVGQSASEAIAAVTKFLKKPIDAAALTAFAVAAGAPALDGAFIFQDLEIEATAAFGGPVPGALDEVGSARRAGGALEAQGWGPRAVATSRAAVAPAVAEYLAVLDGLRDRIRDDDVAGYAMLRPALVAAHGACLTYLTDVTERMLSALPGLDGRDTRAAQQLVETRYETTNVLGSFYVQLETWATEGDDLSRREALRGLRAAARAVGTAARRAAPLADGRAGVVARARLRVTGGPAEPDAPGGVEVAVTYTIANVGDEPLPAGTASLLPQEGLVLGGAADQALPALEPGASVVLAWLVTPEASETLALSSYQIWATAGDAAASLDEILVVTPP